MRTKRHFLFTIWFGVIITTGVITTMFTHETTLTNAQESDETPVKSVVTPVTATTGEALVFEYNKERKSRVGWNYTYGSTGSDNAYALIQTADGGFAFAGSRQETGLSDKEATDMYLLKTNAGGDLQWERTYGVDTEDVIFGDYYNQSEGWFSYVGDRAFDILQTDDGGFVLIGINGPDIILVKTDVNGIMEWNTTYALPLGYPQFSGFVQTGDGGYGLFGNYRKGYRESLGTLLIKTDVNGIMQWNQTFVQGLQDILQTSDGGLIVVGNGNWLGKMDRSGVILWDITYNLDRVSSRTLIQTADGGFVMAGGVGNMSLFKVDVNGAIQWEKNYGQAMANELAYALVQSSDGGFILVGTTRPNFGNQDIWLVKTDKNGVMQWNQRYGGEGTEYAFGLVLTTDGYAVVGSTTSFGAGETDIILVMFYRVSNVPMIVGLILLTTLLALGFYAFKYRIPKGRYGISVNKTVKETINVIFNGNSNKYLFLASGIEKSSDKRILESRIPNDLFKYKFLMHPVRLAMMKLLTEAHSITSIELKNKLRLSWGEFSHHLPNLKKRNLILIEDKFIDGTSKQTIFITTEGTSQYNSLVAILHEFLSSPDFDAFPLDFGISSKNGQELS